VIFLRLLRLISKVYTAFEKHQCYKKLLQKKSEKTYTASFTQLRLILAEELQVLDFRQAGFNVKNGTFYHVKGPFVGLEFVRAHEEIARQFQSVRKWALKFETEKYINVNFLFNTISHF